jgi:uncharacterized membrane protein
MRTVRGIVAVIGLLLLLGATGNVNKEVELAFYKIPFIPISTETMFGIGIAGIALLCWGARPFFFKRGA